MAKQDLVVKLLLDSGAFGNDLRQAERKAKEFKDNMSKAGSTVGDIGKTIGGSLGGVTKVLGGIAAGAGVAVTAFEGFKSVMNSTNETAKIFNGTIAGFENVLDNFQRSLAKMDFSGFINGIDEVYARGKRWKELQMDVNLATVAYNFLNTRDVDIFKSYEKSYRDAKTDADKAKIKTDVAEHLEKMRLNVTDYKDIVNKEFLAGLESVEKMFDEENLIKLFGNDTKLNAGRVVELIYDAMQRRLSNPRLGLMDDDLANYEAVMEEYKKWNKKAKKGIGWKGQTKFDVQNAINQRDKIYTDNQELFFRKALYEYTDEQLNAALAKIINSINQDKAITELELNVKGWGGEAPTKLPTKVEGSIGYLKKLISETEALRDKTEFESDAWKKLTTSLNGYKATLAEMQKIQKVYDGELEEELKIVEGSMLWYSKQIEEKEKLVKNLDVESEEWKKTTAQIKEYTAALDVLLEKYGEAIGKPVNKSGSNTSTKKDEPSEMEKMRGNILSLAEMRKNVEKGSEEWEKLTAQIKAFIAEYAKLEKTESESDPLKKMGNKLANTNMILASTISVFDAMGGIFDLMEDKTGMIMSGITNMLSTFASTAMNLIQIQQAAIATNNAYATSIAAGEAAKLPYPANLAAIATVVATMVAVGAQIAAMAQKANKFAEGGIVGGTSYSGDKLFAMVNSGEMILNKRQQRNLSNMLGGGGGQVEFHISGDSLVGVLNNKRNKTNLTR